MKQLDYGQVIDRELNKLISVFKQEIPPKVFDRLTMHINECVTILHLEYANTRGHESSVEVKNGKK